MAVTENNSSKLKKRALAVAVASCLSLASVAAEAAGLGKLTIFSGLGQPLRAEVEISATPEELAGMTARLASPDVFKQAGVDFSQALSSLRFDIEKRAGGKSVVKLTSTRPVNDPFLDFLVELNWPAGRLVREYTFLLDPPEFAAAQGLQSSVDAKVVETVRGGGRVPESRVLPLAPVATKPAVKGAQTEKPQPQSQSDQSTRLVERGDTLRKIAGETQYPGVSLEQMLVGLYRNNRDAFIANDIHRLKAGAILSIPDETAVAAVSEKDARQVYVSSGDFSAYRRKLATAAATTSQDDSPAVQRSAGRITPKVEEKTPTIDPLKDQVRVSRADASAKGDGSDLDKLAREKALQEAQTRLAMLEKNVGELQTLLAMKNQRLAELEKPVAPSVPVPAEPVKPVVEAVTPPVASEAVPPVVAPKADAADAVSQGTVESAPKPVDAPPVVKAPPPPAPLAPVAVQEPDLLDSLLEDPLPLAGGAAAVALLAGLLVLRRRKQGQSSQGVSTLPAASGLGPNSVFGSTGGQSVDTGSVPQHTGEFSQAGPGTIDTDDVDPVAEADVYMAYGRDAQAEEILLEAMQKDPNRLAIHAKLLEIYANRRSLKQFETLAAELYAQTAGIGPEWEKVAALGGGIDPANPLYGQKEPPAPGLSDSSGKTFDPDATLVVRPALAAATMAGVVPLLDASDAGDEQSATDVLGFSSEPAKLAGAESSYEATLVSGTPMAQEFSSTAGLGELEDGLSLDFDLGSAFEASPPVETKLDAVADQLVAPVDSPSFSVTDGSDSSEALDFDLSGMVGGDSGLGLVKPLAAEPITDDLAVSDFGAIDLSPPVSAESASLMDFSPEATVVNAGALGGGNSIDTAFDLGEMPADTMPDLPVDVSVMEDLAFVPEMAGLPEFDSPLSEITKAPTAKSVDTDLAVVTDDFPDVSSAPAADVGNEMDFDVNLGDSAILGESVPASEFDLGAINLDLSAGASSKLADLSAESAREDIIPNELEEAAFAAPNDPHWEEVNTKLDLAKAYEEMGDLEGARELLQEVLGDGPPDLSAQAKAMLERMGG
jgi:pilus assembly protein FimV